MQIQIDVQHTPHLLTLSPSPACFYSKVARLIQYMQIHTTRHLHSEIEHVEHTNATVHPTQQPSNKSGDKLSGAVEPPLLGSLKNVRASSVHISATLAVENETSPPRIPALLPHLVVHALRFAHATDFAAVRNITDCCCTIHAITQVPARKVTNPCFITAQSLEYSSRD